MKVLFTSSGRRVELISFFKKEGFITFVVDSDPTAPSLYTADKSFIVPRVVDNSEKYIKSLLKICRIEQIDVVIPLIDPELTVLAKAASRFSDIGTKILLSSNQSVMVASDKYETYRFFKSIGLPVPQTLLLGERKITEPDIKKLFPAVLKPRYGSSGKGILECSSIDCFRFYYPQLNTYDYVLQEKVYGEEITIDLFGDGKGNLISAVQRKRLKVRGGEVERGITVKYPRLFEDAAKFAKSFKPFGAVNIQCFYNVEKNEGFYTEINARFGGGYPLAYHAGANFPKYIKELLSNNLSRGRQIGDDYEEGLVMARYDMAVYKHKKELLNFDESSI